jgi:hypothetical protein
MKTVSFSKAISLGALALSLTMLPVSAQNAPTDNVPAGNAPGVTTPLQNESIDDTPDTTYRTEDRTDWGWLGLIGLFGLFGLTKKKHSDEPIRYQDPKTVGQTEYRR